MPRNRTEPVETGGTCIILHKIVWREVSIPKRAANRTPPLPQVAKPMEVICSPCRTVILAHGSTKAGRRGVKDLALTTRITAVEFANLEQELNSLSSTGSIPHSAVIVAL